MPCEFEPLISTSQMNSSRCCMELTARNQRPIESILGLREIVEDFLQFIVFQTQVQKVLREKVLFILREHASMQLRPHRTSRSLQPKNKPHETKNQQAVLFFTSTPGFVVAWSTSAIGRNVWKVASQ